MSGREPAPGDVLGGRYELAGELGRGGMATVFRATDLRLSRQVAVKVFHEGYADAVDPRRTAQEMQLLAGVNHPAVVSVLDAANGDGPRGTWLVMELVEGMNLGLLLARRHGPLPADLARRVVADVAAALEMLHGQGVVHRDVKPANILVVAGAESRRDGVAAKLTDFGIAQMVDGARITAPESILGTAAYLSPEQVRGARLRPASDVYSLGLVLLEALTGERAFPGPAAEAAMARLHRRPALPPSASPALADLLSRMTALDPAARPRASEVAEVLRTGLAGAFTAPDATTTAPTPMQGVPVLTGPSMVLGDATAPVHPATGPVWDALLDEPAASAATPPRRRFPTALAVTAAALAAAAAGIAISAAAGVSASGPVNALGAGGAGAAHSAPATSAAAPPAAAPVPVATLRSPAPPPSAVASPRPSATASRPLPTRTATPAPTPTGTATPSATATPSPSGTPAPSDTPTDTTSPAPDPSVSPSDDQVVVAAG